MSHQTGPQSAPHVPTGDAGLLQHESSSREGGRDNGDLEGTSGRQSDEEGLAGEPRGTQDALVVWNRLDNSRSAVLTSATALQVGKGCIVHDQLAIVEMQ